MNPRFINALLIKRCLYSGARSLVNFEVLKIFKAIHGHVVIPGRYVVEDNKDSRWPSHLIGFKLGNYRKYIQRGMYHKRFDENVMRKLKELGFTAVDNVRVNFDSLKIFKSIYGHLRIPIGYEIGEDGREGWPEHLIGGNLGAYAQYLRKCLKFNTLSPEATKLLIDMGFPQSLKEVERDAFNTVVGSVNDLGGVSSATSKSINSLKTKQNIYELVKMYREGLYGDKVKDLHDMGLAASANEAKGNAILLAAKTFKSKYGHVDIQPDFNIDKKDESWPSETRGLSLGTILNKMRIYNRYSWLRPQLVEIGVSFDVKRRVDFKVYLDALQVYKQLNNGSVNVPKSFIVPKDDINYNPEAYELPLGSWLISVRSRGRSSEEQIEELIKLGVKFDIKSHIVLDALQAYKNIFGDVRVPTNYVIENDDMRYPERTRSLQLGIIVCSIRRGKTFLKHKQAFLDIGLTYGHQTSSGISNEDVYSALLVYKQIYGNVKVPRTFIIPEDDHRFDERMRGECLGDRLYSLYTRGKNVELKQKLVELGVTYNHKSRNKEVFELIYDTLVVYKNINGHVDIPIMFVVPEDSLYPIKAWGMKLGKTLSGIRNNGAYGEHRQRLEAIGVKISAKQLKGM